jgi:hypothetical protein
VTVKAEAGELVKYGMGAEDYRGYREALAAGPYRALLGGRKPSCRGRQIKNLLAERLADFDVQG